jgi:hypothetical protein
MSGTTGGSTDVAGAVDVGADGAGCLAGDGEGFEPFPFVTGAAFEDLDLGAGMVV